MKGNKEGNKFTEGNNEAEKWTEETVLSVLNKMLDTLKKDIDDDGNIVRANDIKLAGEVRLMHGVTKQQWNEWAEKFKGITAVSDLMATITEILECRLIYAGGQIDKFVLTNHYGYRDRIDHTSDEKELGSSFLDFLKQTSNI